MSSQTVRSWKRRLVQSINSSRNGAAYFLALDNVLQANPTDYYASRDMGLANQKAIVQEWEGWMATFRESEHKALDDLGRMSHNQAKAVTEYLVKKELVGRKLDMLTTSRMQLRDNEAEMTHMLRSAKFIDGSGAPSIGETEENYIQTGATHIVGKNQDKLGSVSPDLESETISLSNREPSGVSLTLHKGVTRKNAAPASKGDRGEDLDDTEEADDIYNDNPSEDIDPVSDTNAVDDVSQATDSGALDGIDTAAPGYAYPIITLKDLEREPGPTFAKRKKTAHAGNTIADQAKKKKKVDEKFAETAKSSLQRRHSALGPKWLLESGTVVENVLHQAGLGLSVDHPIRSFMVDLQDKYTESLFSPQDWSEIKSNLPASATYSTEAAEYLDTLEDIVQQQDIISVLDRRPHDTEKANVHRCAESWCDLYGMDPSPFVLESLLSEDWWMNNAWSGTRLLAKAVPGSYIITGEVTGIDSTSRRNNKERYANVAPQNNRKKMGVRADMIWRTLEAPVRDWIIGEAAKQWDENAGKYVRESTFKVPRQLHDILSARSLEVGGGAQTEKSVDYWNGFWRTSCATCESLLGRSRDKCHPIQAMDTSEDISKPQATVIIFERSSPAAETLRLIDEYNRAEQEERKEKRARANRHHDTEDDWRALLCPYFSLVKNPELVSNMDLGRLPEVSGDGRVSAFNGYIKQYLVEVYATAGTVKIKSEQSRAERRRVCEKVRKKNRLWTSSL
ncbi:hypothetical protein BGZ47_004518 [Haplosporangium gracile]|nr:hypothetical protein BGZ47_004518 [Haplosporangium gracile]